MSRDLVVFSLERWDDVWRRNQYLLNGLLRADPGLRVLFVEPANDILHSLVSRRRVRPGAGRRVHPDYGGRLTLYQPTKVLPRVFGPFADASLRRKVSRAIRRVEMDQPVLWVNDPSWAGFVGRTGLPALYDMTDDWLRARRPKRERRRIVENEDLLMARCHVVVVCSEGLRRSRSRQREVVFIANAVDVERYRMPRSRPVDLPPTPTAVYAGTLHEDRLDVALVLRTADALAAHGGSMVLIGPNSLSAESTERLATHPAVAMLGSRPWVDVPAYLQHADVLVVPHVVDAFTDSLDPIKLYEYQAVGRPVVATPVAGFREEGHGVVAVAAQNFPDAVVVIARRRARSRRYPGVPDWSDRVAQYTEVLETVRSRSQRQARR